YSKPAKEKIGPVQSLFTLCVFAVTLLAPAGWIMHHIPQYRRSLPPQP
uniref:Si:dkey-85n7.8 n=2 Tax=Labrus bergylta TaxID=56723 RepID=A0A3Q3G533_9LABR